MICLAWYSTLVYIHLEISRALFQQWTNLELFKFFYLYFFWLIKQSQQIVQLSWYNCDNTQVDLVVPILDINCLLSWLPLSHSSPLCLLLIAWCECLSAVGKSLTVGQTQCQFRHCCQFTVPNQIVKAKISNKLFEFALNCVNCICLIKFTVEVFLDDSIVAILLCATTKQDTSKVELSRRANQHRVEINHAEPISHCGAY